MEYIDVFGLKWYNFKTEVRLEVFTMSDFFMNDKYRVLECMANRQISVNNEQIIKCHNRKLQIYCILQKPK